MKYKDFSYCENMIIIFTCEDKFDIFKYEDINDVICAIKFNCCIILNLFLYDGNIFEDCSEIFGNLQYSSEKSSDIFRNFRKYSEIFVKCSEIFGRLRKSLSRNLSRLRYAGALKRTVFSF